MRQVLVDMARARAAEKRGDAREIALADLPDQGRQPDKSVVAMDDALQRLEDIDPTKSRLIEMRYFGNNLPVMVRHEIVGTTWTFAVKGTY